MQLHAYYAMQTQNYGKKKKERRATLVKAFKYANQKYVK